MHAAESDWSLRFSKENRSNIREGPLARWEEGFSMDTKGRARG